MVSIKTWIQYRRIMNINFKISLKGTSNNHWTYFPIYFKVLLSASQVTTPSTFSYFPPVPPTLAASARSLIATLSTSPLHHPCFPSPKGAPSTAIPLLCAWRSPVFFALPLSLNSKSNEFCYHLRHWPRSWPQRLCWCSKMEFYWDASLMINLSRAEYSFSNAPAYKSWLYWALAGDFLIIRDQSFAVSIEIYRDLDALSMIITPWR